MATAKICLIDFNRYMSANNEDLFSLLNLPEGIDKDTLTGNILLRGGEFECVYSDPYFIQNAIAVWSSKWYRTFDKWVKALAIEYAPLENYDRQEDWTDTTDGSTSGRRDNGNTRTLNYTDTNTLGSAETRTLDLEDERTLDTTNTSTHDVSAYDSSTYQPADKTVTEDDGTDTTTHTGTDTLTRSGNDALSHSGTIVDAFGEGMSTKNDQKLTHKGRIHGNVGVTTSQQMLISELELAEWNLYEHITDIFLSEFVIPIYS